MSEDKIINFEEYRKKIEEDPNLVPCAKCGKLIYLHDTKCEHCGVNFQGVAFQFSRSSDEDDVKSVSFNRLSLLLIIIFIILLIWMVTFKGMP